MVRQDLLDALGLRDAARDEDEARLALAELDRLDASHQTITERARRSGSASEASPSTATRSLTAAGVSAL